MDWMHLSNQNTQICIKLGIWPFVFRLTMSESGVFYIIFEIISVLLGTWGQVGLKRKAGQQEKTERIGESSESCELSMK